MGKKKKEYPPIGLFEKIRFGKYKGDEIKDICDKDPDYIYFLRGERIAKFTPAVQEYLNGSFQKVELDHPDKIVFDRRNNPAPEDFDTHEKHLKYYDARTNAYTILCKTRGITVMYPSIELCGCSVCKRFGAFRDELHRQETSHKFFR